ncbi:Inner membrane protein yohK [Citrobacter koseri]|uniref:Inner membrane protein yohK n=1 Tax=Citrobacter koseri TaxID=545 RepID=A0A2X2VAC2_CITKO|nr:Inner membrane protein yohK [Citrobacter koseri]
MSNFQLSVLCLVITLGIYFVNKRLYRRFRKLPLMPLVLTPALLVLILVFGHISWQNYIGESHWLLWLLGPATIAFAVPVYDNLAIIKRHWMSLTAGVVTATVVAVTVPSGWRACLRCRMRFSAAWPCVPSPRHLRWRRQSRWAVSRI